MTKRVGYRCVHCGSTELRWDAAAAWSEATQEYELVTTYDNVECEACESETRAEEYELEEPTPQDTGPRGVVIVDITGNPDEPMLYWSNVDGWGDATNATQFTLEEARILRAPMGNAVVLMEYELVPPP